MHTYEIWVSGRVQGVGFRYSTMHYALNHAICGNVRNLSDSRVAIRAQGPKATLDRFVEDLYHNVAPYAKVSNVEAYEIETQIEYKAFQISYEEGL